jgi:hypothetical protein
MLRKYSIEDELEGVSGDDEESLTDGMDAAEQTEEEQLQDMDPFADLDADQGEN